MIQTFNIKFLRRDKLLNFYVQPIDSELLVLFLVYHFIADFILQTDKIAINKSKDLNVLIAHSALYGIGACWYPMVAVILIISHFCIDGITSKITSYLWAKDERHWFFVMIGFDQLLHMMVIVFILINWNVLS